MNTEEVSNTGDGGVDNQQNLQERSVNTNPSLIQGECKIDMIESEDVLTNLTMQLSDVLKDLDINTQLSVFNFLISTFDRLDNAAIKKVEDCEARIEKELEELLEIKDVAPAKYEESSRRLLEAKGTVNERKREFSQKSLELKNLFTTQIEKSKQKEDEKQELVEKLVGVNITAVEENLE